jgi:hypothetical protein
MSKPGRYIPTNRRAKIKSAALGHRPGHAHPAPDYKPVDKKGMGRKPRDKR